MGEIEQMNKREKLFSFPDSERSRNGVPDFADFSLDSGLKKDLLQMIQKKCFRQLADSELEEVHAAGVPCPMEDMDRNKDDTMR